MTVTLRTKELPYLQNNFYIIHPSALIYHRLRVCMLISIYFLRFSNKLILFAEAPPTFPVGAVRGSSAAPAARSPTLRSARAFCCEALLWVRFSLFLYSPHRPRALLVAAAGPKPPFPEYGSRQIYENIVYKIVIFRLRMRIKLLVSAYGYIRPLPFRSSTAFPFCICPQEATHLTLYYQLQRKFLPINT